VKLVVDTHVWLEALVFDDPRTRALLPALRSGQAQALATAAMDAEFDRVIARPTFALDADTAARLAATRQALVCPVAEAPDCRLDCTDPDDRMFIDLAVARRADWLLSRDRALLRLRRAALARFGVLIGPPERWAQAAGSAHAAAYNPPAAPPARHPPDLPRQRPPR
jgi:predicted nucleic acid-binding protein